MTLEVINISKTYNTLGRKKVVFKNLSFTVPRGVNLGVIGANGSGKSTLLNMIAGATPPDTGRIVRDMTVSWPLGYSGGVQINLSGKVNCRFLARLYGKDPDWVTDFVAEFSELEDYMDWPVKTYSSGMRSRLAFALSMAIDFECLLVDEGMSAGDQFFKGKAEAAIDERRKRSSLILVSHDLREVTRLCDWILVLGEPELYVSDEVEERCKKYALEQTRRREAMSKQAEEQDL